MAAQQEAAKVRLRADVYLESGSARTTSTLGGFLRSAKQAGGIVTNFACGVPSERSLSLPAEYALSDSIEAIVSIDKTH